MSRRSNRAEGENKGSFSVMMTSLSVILLAFFILLYTLASIDNKRVKLALGSLSGSFRLFPGGMRPSKGSHLYSKNVVEMGIEETYKSMRYALSKRGLEDELTMEESEEGVSFIFGDRIFFRLGSAEIDPEAVPILDAIARIIAKMDRPVRIEGHTDDLPIHNERYPTNWELSTARAVNVLRYFIAGKAVPTDRLSAAGFSQYQPRVPNTDNENRAANRRIAIVILNKAARMDNKPTTGLADENVQ